MKVDLVWGWTHTAQAVACQKDSPPDLTFFESLKGPAANADILRNLDVLTDRHYIPCGSPRNNLGAYRKFLLFFWQWQQRLIILSPASASI